MEFKKITEDASKGGKIKRALDFVIKERPNASPGIIAKYLGVSANFVVESLRPNGFPREWTKESVEEILTDIVWKNARGVTIHDLRGEKIISCTPLWRAFVFHGFPNWYPLENYRKKFHRMIYPLFNLEMPQSLEDERETEWPDDKILRKRYLYLMRLHHPDYHNQNYISAKVATINCQLITDAYQKIMKRKKRLAIGDPPPINREEMAIYTKRKIN